MYVVSTHTAFNVFSYASCRRGCEQLTSCNRGAVTEHGSLVLQLLLLLSDCARWRLLRLLVAHATSLLHCCCCCCCCCLCCYCCCYCMRAQCTFTSNQAHNNGGAVALEVATTVDAEDCVFSGNRVTIDTVSTDIGDGGTSSQQSTFIRNVRVTFRVAFTVELKPYYSRHSAHTASVRCILYTLYVGY
jgi:predicted outer membrane repeat protein